MLHAYSVGIAARSRRRASNATLCAVCLVTTLGFSTLTASAAAPASITAKLIDNSTIQLFGSEFPATATVRVDYNFANQVVTHSMTTNAGGEFQDQIAVPAGFSGAVKIAARARIDQPSTTTVPNATETNNSPTDRNAYYVDCESGGAGGDGSQTKPWMSPASLSTQSFAPGSSINFKRGCKWDVSFSVSGKGSEAQPVVLRPYGDVSATPPSLSASVSMEDRNAAIITLNDPYMVVDGLHFTDTHGVGIAVKGAHSRVQNVSVDKVGIGLWLYGEYSIADHVSVSDLHMVVATQGGDDDYGAVGFNVESNNITVQNSSCTNCIAPSPDYETDGGFVEVWKRGDNLKVVNNTATHTNGFFEAGGEGGTDSANNVIISNNTIDDVQGMGVVIHMDGNFSLGGGASLTMENNTITDSKGFSINGPTNKITLKGNTLNGKPL